MIQSVFLSLFAFQSWAVVLNPVQFIVGFFQGMDPFSFISTYLTSV